MKNNKGVTLIILIITVIILMILTGLTIDFAIDGKIIDKAKETQASIKDKADEHTSIVESVRNLYSTDSSGGNTGGDNTTDNPPVIQGSAPVLTTTALNAKTINSFTVDALATDIDGGNLTYKLFIVGVDEAFDTKTAEQNTTVQLTASGLEMYTDYTYYVLVSDNTSNSISNEAEAETVKTKCSGQTIKCETLSCTAGSVKACTNSKCSSGKVSCTACNGAGSVSCSASIYTSSGR